MNFHRLMVERRPKLTGIREGMFGRIFPDLPPLQVAPEEILAIGIELLRADPSSSLNAKPDWRPTLPARGSAFTLADLLLASSRLPGLSLQFFGPGESAWENFKDEL